MDYSKSRSTPQYTAYIHDPMPRTISNTSPTAATPPTNPARTRALSPTSSTETQPKRQKAFVSSTSLPSLFSTSNLKSECWDWILTPGNTHYARDLTNFTSYRPLNPPVRISNSPPTSATSTVGADADSDELTVVGIGSVCLPVERGSFLSSDSGNGTTGVLVLNDVLHIPEALCNGFNPVVYGGWMRSEGGVVVGGSEGEGTGEWFARAFAGSFRVEMAGGRKGGSEVVDGGEYRFGVWVSEAEKRAMLEAMGDSNGMGG